tara:strand:+ start:1063 stop:1407 length:345 start_codon:yes stop_codon:yes gene_type:complete
MINYSQTQAGSVVDNRPTKMYSNVIDITAANPSFEIDTQDLFGELKPASGSITNVSSTSGAEALVEVCFDKNKTFTNQMTLRVGETIPLTNLYLIYGIKINRRTIDSQVRIILQ